MDLLPDPDTRVLSQTVLLVAVVVPEQSVVTQQATCSLATVDLELTFRLGLDSLLEQPTRAVAVAAWLTATSTGETRNQTTQLVELAVEETVVVL
jgi:hypothetical protein